MDANDAKLKHELYALGQAVLGFVVLSLVLMGIGGTIYKVISPEGWVVQVFGRSLSAGAAALGSLIMIAARAWFSRGWHASASQRHRFSDLLVYSFAGAGMLYLVKLWVIGSF
jgi:hypothetical protein